MPTNSYTGINEQMLREYERAMARNQATFTRGFNGTWTVATDMAFGASATNSQTDSNREREIRERQDANDRRYKAREKEELLTYLGKGDNNGNFYFRTAPDGASQLTSDYSFYNVPGGAIFTIKNGKLYVHKQRTSHLRSLLNRFAESQGLSVVIQDDKLDDLEGDTNYVIAGAFVPMQPDDSQLVSSVRIYDERTEERNPFNEFYDLDDDDDDDDECDGPCCR